MSSMQDEMRRRGRECASDAGSSRMLSCVSFVDGLESQARFADGCRELEVVGSHEPDVVRRRKSRTGYRSPTEVANRMSFKT